MAKSNLALAIENDFLSQFSALGNSKTDLKKVACDLLNQHGRKHAKAIAEGCFLSKQTVQRLMDEGGEETYHPRADTLERVFRFYGAARHFEKVRITPRYRNKEKV